MYATIKDSHKEEGGKLIGKIIETENEYVLQIDSFLDSGPNIDHSSTHIYPDGPYQESLFRICESFDPEIEHLGSWHSHHCNGLPELSHGDISGYRKNVNNKDYNLDIFLAILIPKLSDDYHDYRFYVFFRNKIKHFEIDPKDVQIINEEFELEKMLENIEEKSFNKRKIDEQYNLAEQDKDMLKAYFPNVQCLLNKKKKRLYWRWSRHTNDDIQFKYEYHFNDSRNCWEGKVFCIDANKIIQKSDVALDRFRFNKLTSFVKQCSEQGKATPHIRFF